MNHRKGIISGERAGFVVHLEREACLERVVRGLPATGSNRLLGTDVTAPTREGVAGKDFEQLGRIDDQRPKGTL